MEQREYDQPLLTTKLAIPATYLKRIIARERLHERLDIGAQRPLTLVVAPAGFGKTTLIGEWAGKREKRVAWVSLDQSDNVLERFWSYVIAALAQDAEKERRKRERSMQPLASVDAYESSRTTANTANKFAADQRAVVSMQPLVAKFAIQSIETVIASLLNQLVSLPEEVILVLDDYQVIIESAVHQSVAFLIEHLPPQIHLIIASRIEPPFPLARLRVQGKVSELRAMDLRFTQKEITEFLQQGMGLTLNEEDVQELNQRSEGWIAGLQLAALSLQNRKDPLTVGNFIKAFTGSNRNIVSYLSDEVIDGLPEEVQNFLLATAILEKVRPELCDAVTQQHNGERMLEWLDQANLFLSSVDEQEGWYRYQRLFAELLKYRLKQEPEELETVLHMRASAWFEQHNMHSEAVSHLLAAHELERSVELIERHAWSFIQQGMQKVVADWLSRLPEEILEQRALLAYLQAWVYLAEGRVNSYEEALQRVEKQYVAERDSGLPEYIYEIKAEYALLCGNGILITRYAEQALALAGEEESWLRRRASLLQGIGQLYSGETEKAQASLTEREQRNQRSSNREEQEAINIYMSDIYFLRGELHAIIQTLSATSIDNNEHSTWYKTAAHMRLAAVYYEWNELVSAEEHWEKAAHLSEQSVYTNLATATRYILAVKLANARGEIERVHKLLEQAEQYEINIPLMIQIAALHSQILLEQSDLRGAVQRSEQYRAGTEEMKLPEVYEAQQQMRARLAIAQGQPQRAIEILQEAARGAQEKQRLSSEIKILTLLSVAQHAEGSMQSALQTLEKALRLAGPCSYVRTILDEGPVIAVLLAEFYNRYKKRTASEQHELASIYIATLLIVTGEKGKHVDWIVPESSEEFILDRLSEREQMVLSLIAEGLANQEIAQKLVVTVSTIKTHLNNIYAKLHVHTRLQAVTKAYDIGILRRSEIDTEPLAPPRVKDSTF